MQVYIGIIGSECPSASITITVETQPNFRKIWHEGNRIRAGMKKIHIQEITGATYCLRRFFKQINLTANSKYSDQDFLSGS